MAGWRYQPCSPAGGYALRDEGGVSTGRRFRRERARRAARARRERCEGCGAVAAGWLLDVPLCIECRDLVIASEIETDPARVAELLAGCGCGRPDCLGVVVLSA